MRPFFDLPFLLCLAGLLIKPAGIPIGADPSEDVPGHDTPLKLKEVWLHFHGDNLCQGMDAIFEFSTKGIKLRCLVEDDRSYQMLEELLAPLRNSFHVELYPTRLPPVAKVPDGDVNPPAGIWENYELRAYFGDTYARTRVNPAYSTLPETFAPPPDETLKQRLLVYAEQTIEWNRKMKRYAMDLPVLVRVALDFSESAELRSQANAVCLAHAHNLAKTLGRLRTNLSLALPRAAKRGHTSPPSEKSGNTWKTPADGAEQIAITSRNVAGRIHHLIYPENFTVGLEELRDPDLMEAVRSLEKMVLDFQKAIAKGR